MLGEGGMNEKGWGPAECGEVKAAGLERGFWLVTDLQGR
jgi:hypothetical protein